MAAFTCSRCGAAAAQKVRCLTCGGVPLPTPQFEKGNPQVAEDVPDAGPAELDPRLRGMEDKLADHLRQLGELEARERALARELAQSAGQLRRDVTRAVTSEDARLSAQRTDIAAQRRKFASEADKSERRAAVEQANEVKRLALGVRDLAGTFHVARPPLPRADLTTGSLCPTLQSRDLLAVGDLTFPEATALDRALPRIPALVPFLNAGHIVVSAPRGAPALANMIVSLLGQLYLAAPPGQLAVTVFNPRLNTILSAFQSQGAAEAKILASTPPNEAALQVALDDHLGQIINVDAAMAGRHPTLGALVAATGQHEHQYRCLTLLDGPAQWSPKAVDALERILHEGATRGVSVILHLDPTTPGRQDPAIERLLLGQTVLTATAGGGWTLSLASTEAAVPVAALAPPSLADQQHIMNLVVVAARAGALPKVPFKELLDFEMESSQDGISCRLGKKGSEVVQFTMGDTIVNLHNALVGGAVGTGKTNLLMVLIYSLATRYAPEDLQMFLLDFKEGVEFQRFAGDGVKPSLPHAKVVSLESDADFGVAVLAHFEDEMSTRAGLFKAAGVKDFAAYRRQGGTLPRWLLVADEFQVLFQEETAEVAARKLENVARKGRGFGLHVVLASQTLSGIRIPGSKDQAIYGQCPVRIVLRLPKPDSQLFLGSDNLAATRLRYRGQAILNTGYGNVEDNQQFVVAYADEKHLDEVQASLAQTFPGRAPRVYRGSSQVALRELRAARAPKPDPDIMEIWLGQECTVDAAPATTHLQAGAANNILVLGSDVGTACATVQTAALCAASAQVGVEIVVFDGLPDRFRAAAGVEAWIATLRRLGATVTVVAADRPDAVMESLAEDVPPSGRRLLTLLGPEFTEFQQAVMAAGWTDKMKSCSRKGIHVLGHWADLTAVPGKGDKTADYHTIVFARAATSVIADASGVLRSRIPPPAPGRCLMFEAHDAGAGLRTIASIAPLTPADLGAW